MRIFALMFLFLLSPTAHAQVAGSDPFNPPLQTSSAFSGTMFANESEFLTPGGITDTPPPPPVLPDDNLLTAIPALEPAAGPLPDISSSQP